MHKFLCKRGRQFVYRVPLLLQEHQQDIKSGREAVNYGIKFPNAAFRWYDNCLELNTLLFCNKYVTILWCLWYIVH